MHYFIYLPYVIAGYVNVLYIFKESAGALALGSCMVEVFFFFFFSFLERGAGGRKNKFIIFFFLQEFFSEGIT